MVILLSPENFFKLRFTNRYATAAMLGSGAEALEAGNVVTGDLAQPLDMFMRANKVQASEVLRKVRNCIIEAQYDVYNMVAREHQRIREVNE